MRRRARGLPLAYGLMILFVARAQPGGPATSTAQPAATQTSAPATGTREPATEAATRTEAAPETATPAPATPTDAPTLAATETASGPATSTPVLEALETTSTTSTSPDGQWVAVAAVSFPTSKNGVTCENCGDQYFARLTVRRADGSQMWTAIAEWRQMGLGYNTPKTLIWSAEGDALYFTETGYSDGCGHAFTNGSGLKRLNLSDGTVTELLSQNGYWLTISPDETQVAYLEYGDRQLGVRDFATGAEQHYPLNDLGTVEMGEIVWAPDASAVVIAVVNNTCVDLDAEPSQWVIQVRLADGARTVLVEPSTTRRLKPVAWPSADKLVLVDGAGARWLLTISSGQIAPEA